MKAASCPHFLLRKLLTLGEHCEELDRLATAAEGRLSASRVELNTATLRPDQFAAVRKQFDALVVEAPKQRSRAEVERRLSNAKAWVEQLPHSCKLEPAIVVDVNGYDLATLRGRLHAIAHEVREIEHAPSPPPDVEQKIRDYVDDLRAKGRPLFHRLGDTLDIRWPASPHASRVQVNGFDSEYGNALLMAVWLNPDALVERLLKEIAEISAQPIPVADRPAMLAQLNAEMMALRYTEESLVCRALANNEVVTRDVAAPPPCVLQVRQLVIEERVEEQVA